MADYKLGAKVVLPISIPSIYQHWAIKATGWPLWYVLPIPKRTTGRGSRRCVVRRAKYETHSRGRLRWNTLVPNPVSVCPASECAVSSRRNSISISPQELQRPMLNWHPGNFHVKSTRHTSGRAFYTHVMKLHPAITCTTCILRWTDRPSDAR